MCLEGFQSGLSWLTILRKRAAFREAFAGFDPELVSRFGSADVERLLGNAQIVRHRGKIEASVGNAQVVLDISSDYGSFDEFVWRFAPSPTPHQPTSLSEVAATTPESIALAKALKAEGARFVGPTTAYAFMQSMGLVNDHIVGCDFAGHSG